MKKEQFEQYIKTIQHNLDFGRLNEALRIEENVLYTNPSWPYLDDVISIRQAYHGLLSCMEQGFQDPNRKEQFDRLIGQAYQILHKFVRFYKLQDSYSLFKKSCDENHHLPLEEYIKQLEQFQLVQLMSEEDPAQQGKRLQAREDCRHNLFIQLWTSPAFTADELKGLEQLLDSALIHKNDKAVCLGALLLHEEIMPSIEVLKLLTQFTLAPGTDEELQVRALTNVLLCLLTHYKEYKYQGADFKTVYKALRTPALQEKTSVIFQKLFMSVHSQDILRRIQQDLMPLLYDPKALNENADKLQQASAQIQRLIKKGIDVQYASMYHEKKFPFFKQIENWFLPFDTSHTLTVAALHDEKFATKELNIILSNPSICDNDRWSIFFKIKQVNIPIELTGISPEEIEMVDMRATTKSLAGNYIADLFRFYTIFTYHQEFDSPFTQKRLPVSCLDLISLLFDAEHQLQMAGVLNKTEFYTEAITLADKHADGVLSLEANTLKGDIFFTGFNDKEKAKACYQKALAIKENSTLKHKLAICYLETGEVEKSAQLFLELLEEDPENSQLIKETTHSLVKSYAIEQAIPLLYKLVYLEEDKYNDYSYGKLAWCYLAQDKLEEAWAAFDHIKERSLPDMLLGGKICWAMEDYKNAIDFFKYYIKKNPDKTKAMSTFFESDDLMKRYNLKEFELQLIWDIIHKD